MRSSLISLAAIAAFASSAVASSNDRFAQVVKRQEAAATGPSDVAILNYALTLEHLEKNFYQQALAKFSADDFRAAGFSRKVYNRFRAIAFQEKAHVDYLVAALGPAGVSQCEYEFTAALSSVKSFIATSRILESVGTAAYLGAAPDVDNPAFLAAAGSVLTIEARHTAFLNEISMDTAFPVAFETALNYAQVYSLAAPFIKPGTCGAAKDLPSSIKVFPALTYITKIPRTGHTSAISFPKVAGVSTYYAAFLNGGATLFAKVSTGPDGVDRVNIPAGLDGITYTIITSAESLTDATTIAGPSPVIL